MDMITCSVNSDDDDDGWDLGITLTLILSSLFLFSNLVPITTLIIFTPFPSLGEINYPA